VQPGPSDLRSSVSEQRFLVWFLIAGPSGDIVDGENYAPEKKLIRRPCSSFACRSATVFRLRGKWCIEEQQTAVCPQHYNYYFTVDFVVKGLTDVSRLKHFDKRGSERVPCSNENFFESSWKLEWVL